MSEATSEPRRKHRRKREMDIIPPGCAVLLSKEQIRTAIGVSSRTFDGMLSSGKYPKHDARIGAFPRWTVETHNAWIAAQCRSEGA